MEIKDVKGAGKKSRSIESILHVENTNCLNWLHVYVKYDISSPTHHKLNYSVIW